MVCAGATISLQHSASGVCCLCWIAILTLLFSFSPSDILTSPYRTLMTNVMIASFALKNPTLLFLKSQIFNTSTINPLLSGCKRPIYTTTTSNLYLRGVYSPLLDTSYNLTSPTNIYSPFQRCQNNIQVIAEQLLALGSTSIQT